LAFFAQTTASFCKNLIITLFFEKNSNFFAENWQKSQKIVITTSTPDQAPEVRPHKKFCLGWRSPTSRRRANQGDQIGRKFANWAKIRQLGDYFLWAIY
jgi:hypothetical protein